MISHTYLKLSKSSKSEVIDFRLPIEELVQKLNEINPILIGGYVSTFLLLAEEKLAGRLNISVKYMVAIGTAYSKDDRNRVKEVFNCETFTTYSCTEAGEVASECRNGNFHIVPDVIVEAIDEDSKPVKDGVESNSILVTNLWNKTTPFIRYQLNDRCIIHNENCGCGNKSKWIEVVGRSVFIVPFKSNKNTVVNLTDFAFELILNETCGGCADHQIIIQNNDIEVRLTEKDSDKRQKLFDTIKYRFDKLAKENNFTLNITLSSDNPIVEQTGKFKRIKLNLPPQSQAR